MSTIIINHYANHVRYICYRRSVCRLSSATFVHPTHRVEILRNFSSPFGTLAIHWHSLNILRRSSQEDPSVGGLNARGVAKYSDFSEGEITFTFAICYRPSVYLSIVCLSSVMFVRPTQPVDIFGNFSSPSGTLATHWHSVKFLRSLSQGNLSVGGFTRKRGSEI